MTKQTHTRSELEIQTHIATVIRNTKRSLYAANKSLNGKEAYVNSYDELIEKKNLWSGKLDYPVLEENDELYITSLDESVWINKVVRSTDNSFIYYAHDERIKDEVSVASKIKAEEEKVRLEQEIRDEEKLTISIQEESIVDKYAKTLSQITEAINDLQHELKQG